MGMKGFCGGFEVEIINDKGSCMMVYPTKLVTQPTRVMNERGQAILLEADKNTAYMIKSYCVSKFDERIPLQVGDVVRSIIGNRVDGFVGVVTGFEGDKGVVCKSLKENKAGRVRFTYQRHEIERSTGSKAKIIYQDDMYLIVDDNGTQTAYKAL